MKNIPDSVIETVKQVTGPKKSYDPAHAAAAIASIDKNVEQGAISPEVGDQLKKVWQETVQVTSSKLLEIIAKSRPILPSDPEKFDAFAAGLELSEAKKKIHPLEVHTQYVPRGAFDKHTEGARRAYKVVAVGQKVKGIKVGEHLSDTDLDDMRELGFKHKSNMKESLDILPTIYEHLTSSYKEGQKVAGTNDGGHPEWHTEHDISRLHDVVTHVKKHFGAARAQEVWRLFPESLRMEHTYSNWRYRHPVKTEEVDFFLQRFIEDSATEQLLETLKSSDPASKWIHDFVHSTNPKFEGKSKAKRIKMALAAHYGANEEVLDELSKKTLGNYVTKSSTSISSISHAIGQRRGETDVAGAALGWMSDREARSKAQSTIHNATAKSNQKDRHKLAGRLAGTARAVKGLTKEEIELDEATGKGIFHVISSEHGLFGEGPGMPQVLYSGSHAKAHKLAKTQRDKRLKTYPKGYEAHDDREGYHIRTSDDEAGVAHTYHVVSSRLKSHLIEHFSNEDESNTLSEAPNRELGHLLRKKVKDMSGAEQRRAAEMAKGKHPAPAKSVKEEIEADQNILVHLRKSIDTEGKHETLFADGSKESIPQDIAEPVLEHVLRLKPEARLHVQEYLQQSFENVVEVAQLIREGAR